MNERIERLIKIARERDEDSGFGDFLELRDRLEDLLDDEGQIELTQAWENMLRDRQLDKWDEDFLKAIDGTYEGEPFGYATKKQRELQILHKQQEYELYQQQQAYTIAQMQGAQNSVGIPSSYYNQAQQAIASTGPSLLSKITGR